MKIYKKVLLKIIHSRIGRLIPDITYLKIKYKIFYDKKLDLKNPTTFNEKLQWLKLYNRNELYTKIVDKYEVKEYVSNIIGNEYVIPTIGIFDKWDEIDFNELPNQFVIKCTHDSGGLVVCRNKEKLDYKKAKKIINTSLKNNYFYRGREFPYKNVKPRILIEKYIGFENHNKTKTNGIISPEELQSEVGLLDYKFMCFNGKVKSLFLDIGVIGDGTGHAEEYYRNIYNTDFELEPYLETRDNYPKQITAPKNFKTMIKIAEKLSKNIPHVRVDLYNINGKIFFGEMTFFHGGGMSNHFIPEKYNDIYGTFIKLPDVSKNNK